MSFITTNPNPFIVNLPELQSVLTNATGATQTDNYSEYIDSNTSAASFNSIASYNSGVITISNDLYLSNANIYVNNSPIIVNNNTINGNAYTALTVNNNEVARLNLTGLGIYTQTPLAPLHVNGYALFGSTIFLSSFGATPGPSVGNLIADGFIQANSIIYPSDPRLKTNIRPYTTDKLPNVVEFEWIQSGKRDIGVLADEMQAIEPACVESLHNGKLGVDYAKLVVLCISKIDQMQRRLDILESSDEPISRSFNP